MEPDYVAVFGRIQAVDTILRVLHEADLSWQRDRTWCETGVVQRKRKAGVVAVVDPATAAKRG